MIGWHGLGMWTPQNAKDKGLAQAQYSTFSFLLIQDHIESKIVMNEELLGEAKTRKRMTNHQGSIQDEDFKLMLVNGSPAPTPTINPMEAITPTPTTVKMKVLPDLHSYPPTPTPTTYLIHQMRELEDASWLKAPR